MKVHRSERIQVVFCEKDLLRMLKYQNGGGWVPLPTDTNFQLSNGEEGVELAAEFVVRTLPPAVSPDLKPEPPLPAVKIDVDTALLPFTAKEIRDSLPTSSVSERAVRIFEIMAETGRSYTVREMHAALDSRLGIGATRESIRKLSELGVIQRKGIKKSRCDRRSSPNWVLVVA